MIALALLQPTGFALGAVTIEEIGFATMSSPLPRVFTNRQGLEDFSLHHDIRWTTVTGLTKNKRLTAADLRRITGPFARRAVYAAAIGYAPRLPESLWLNVLGYGFCRTSTLSDSLGEPERVARATIELTSRARGRPRSWKVSVRCARRP